MGVTLLKQAARICMLSAKQIRVAARSERVNINNDLV